MLLTHLIVNDLFMHVFILNVLDLVIFSQNVITQSYGETTDLSLLTNARLFQSFSLLSLY